MTSFHKTALKLLGFSGCAADPVIRCALGVPSPRPPLPSRSQVLST